tara:strand:+ start:2194 stop:2916 length:723 start_codon:yes stop_codon:yes gene_type:complete
VGGANNTTHTHFKTIFFVDLDMKKYLFTAIFIAFTFKANILAQDFNADPLSETPLYPIPSEMTFEEYEDMNRRLSQAYLWSSIPIPGSTHYYAGEKRMAKRLFYIGIGGLACVIGGALSMGESDWPNYNENIHIIHNPNNDNERRYEKIPMSIEGEIIHYDLKEIYKSSSGDGGGLLAIGIAIILGDFIYDRLKGLHLIEKKRGKVRYKYGKQLQLTYNPMLNFSNNQNQFGMRLNFDLF